jgi:HlyD family secretion protein
MTGKQKALVATLVVVLLGSAAGLSFARNRERGVEVRLEPVATRDLVESITASGNIRARRTVSISSDVSARVSQVAIEEGDDVVAGQVLLRLDPAQLEAAVARAEAALSQAASQQSNQRTNELRAQRDYDRLVALRSRDSVLVSRQQLDDAKTTLEIAQSNLEASGFGVQQARASLDEARDRLSKTIIRAPMAGKVTRLNIEEGETAIIGTMNNPGSLLLTISDLSMVEVVIQVDETEVPNISVGDSAHVDIDAFPDIDFAGRVTEIGQSAVRPPSSTQAAGGQQAAIDFQVVITLDQTLSPVLLRPDLSATAEIITDTRESVVAVPIIALTVRPDSALIAARDSAAAAGDEDPAAQDEAPAEIEGVFIVKGGKVTFTPVTLGIAGQEYFEALEGVQVGDTVVAGPYQAIRDLKNGDQVRSDGAATPARPAAGG